MIPLLAAALSGPYALPLAAILLLSYLLASYTRAYLRLRHFPGPPLAHLSYLWLASKVHHRRQGDLYAELFHQYGPGPLVRVGPNDLMTNSPEIVRRMSAARSSYVRSSWYHALKFDPNGDSMLSMVGDPAVHDRYKAKALPGYSGRETALEKGIDEQVAGLVGLIRRKYVNGKRNIDLATVLSYFTLDVITSVAYGGAFGFLETDSDVHDYNKIVEATVPAIAMLCEVPWLQPIFLSKWFLSTLGPKPTDKKGMGKIMGVTQAMVAKRFEAGAETRPDMLGSFIRNGMTQWECEQEVLLQIAAGSDTTAAALKGTMLLICSTPHVYYKLQREIDNAIASGKASSPIRNDEAKTLPYLQAVIYEGLRLNAPFTGPVMKQVPPGGDTIDGKFIPAGVRIGTAVKAVQQNEIFGSDPEIFRPERFSEASPEQRMRMAGTMELLFGHGRWMCAGKPVAFMELNKVYFELLRRFDFQIVNPKKPWREANVNLVFHSDLWMKVTERGENKA